jgi:hypothetical protein
MNHPSRDRAVQLSAGGGGQMPTSAKPATTEYGANE